MNFVLKMAWRDSRASRRRLLLHALSIVLGVAALVGISSLGDNLRRAVDSQSKGLLGADLAVFGRHEFTPALEARLQKIGGELAHGISLTTMAGFGEGASRLVQVAGVEPGYPYYGDVETSPSAAASRLSDDRSALIEEAALTQSGLVVGGPLRLGSTSFTVAGALKKYPGMSPMTAMFAPRVQISLTALRATGLLKRGSLAQYAIYLRLPGGTDAATLAKTLKEEFKGDRLNITTAEDRREQIGEALQNVFSFISLVGFLALFLGAVGIASALHVYIRQRLATVAVLRCLGASARTSFAVYLTQGIGLGLVGTGLGVGLGLLLQAILPVLLRAYLPSATEFTVSWISVFKGVGAGVGISALFTLLPLLEVRRVTPLHVLRSGLGDEPSRPDPARRIVYAAIAAGVVGFSILQTGNWRIGLAFSAAMAIGLAVLAGAAKAAVALARRTNTSLLPYAWRQGVANIHRPQNRTQLLVMSLGLGTFLLLTLALTRSSLLARLEGMGAGSRPNLIFFDVQPDQIGLLEEIAVREKVPLMKTSPIITMRLTSIKGFSTEQLAADPKTTLPNWALRREYRSTWRRSLDEAEQVSEGSFIGEVPPGVHRIPVSIESGLSKDLQLKLGDELEFDVQGVPLKAKIGSIRQVEWRRMQTNFFFVFPAGPLDGAPATYAAAARADTPEDTARLQRAVARELPNVSAIDLGFVLRMLDGIMAKISWAVSFLASFTVLTGVVVLAGAILMGRHQRVREAVLLRTLGAQRVQLRQMMLAEYAGLGLLSALAGAGLAVIAHALLAHFVFKVPAAPAPGLVAMAVLAVTGLTMLTGLVANRGVSGSPPLEILRQET